VRVRKYLVLHLSVAVVLLNFASSFVCVVVPTATMPPKGKYNLMANLMGVKTEVPVKITVCDDDVPLLEKQVPTAKCASKPSMVAPGRPSELLLRDGRRRRCPRLLRRHLHRSPLYKLLKRVHKLLRRHMLHRRKLFRRRRGRRCLLCR
jgi:hypothetical protein